MGLTRGYIDLFFVYLIILSLSLAILNISCKSRIDCLARNQANLYELAPKQTLLSHSSREGSRRG